MYFLAQMFNLILGVLFVMAAWLAGREYHPVTGLVSALFAGSAPWLMYLSGVAYVENGMLFFGMLAVACLCRYERLGRENPGVPTPAVWVLLAGLFSGFACGFKYTALPWIAAVLLAAVIALSAFRGTSRSIATNPNGSPMPKSLGWKNIGVLCLAFGLGVCITFSPWLIKNIAATGNPVFPLAYRFFGARDGVWTDALAQQWDHAHTVTPTDQPILKRLFLARKNILLDQRLGPALFILMLPILISRNRSRWDVLLMAMVIAQFLMWLFGSHLYARFAVPMLIPLCVLAGRSFLAFENRLYRATYLTAVLAAMGVNLCTAWSLFAADLVPANREPGAPKFWPVYGVQDYFVAKDFSDVYPAAYARNRLSPDAKILMVGDARAFYMPKGTSYCVVFNRNLFADAVASASSDEDIIRWLNQNGYTHLLVDFLEMQRLRGTYGFWPELNRGLFRRLEDVGLGTVKEFRDHPDDFPYAVLYEIRQMPPVP